MQIVSTKKELQTLVQACKASRKTIGLVPTMGALHQGHASLVKRAVADNDICVVSVFVNPTQFNNKEDLAKYPRNIERDAELLSSIGADYVFAPTPEEMYSAEEMNTTFAFDFAGLDQVMEGKMRPGHFNGVVQVVSRLFYLVCPIVREESGLALSSRNERLSAEEKETALAISKTLFESLKWAKEATATASSAHQNLAHSVAAVRQRVIDAINAVPGLEVEYYEIVDQTTLLPTDTFEHAIGCVTVYCGPVRLIDNIKYE